MGNGRLALILIIGGLVLGGTLTILVPALAVIDRVMDNSHQFTNAYMVTEGLPGNPAETVAEYHTAMRDAEEGSRLRTLTPLLIVLGLAAGFFALNMTIGRDGLTGLLQQGRLTLLAWNRGRRPNGDRPQNDDDAWMDEAFRQPPALPPVDTPWLLPARAEGREEPR